MNDAEFTEDVKKFGDMLFRLAYSCTGDMSVCDDIVQDTFIKYYRLGKEFDGEEGKKAWLIRVTINCCHNHTRFWWHSRRSELPENEPAKEPSDHDELISLRDALQKLRPAYRIVIHLYYYEGFTAEQIAKMLHLSVSAITSRLQRGREMLKKYLE
ncbi:MAG: RNA polymerase sigma factor [Ruminiclostridium sp.]|nr:RNA polymerase sigma factor [Ruminiclostridium sp.]